jgi:hypothetical protein
VFSSPAHAQTDRGGLTAIQAGLACALPPTLAVPRGGLRRVIGGQDTQARAVYGPRDTLIIDGGTKAGLAPGQRFFVRRAITFGSTSPSRTHAVHTAGWIRIVAVNATTAVASIDYSCSDIDRGDYLEPFFVPEVPEGAERNDPSGALVFPSGEENVPAGELNYDDFGHILFGSEEHVAASAGNFMLINQGTDHGAKSGARFAVYRHHHIFGVPLVAIGEGIIMTTGKRMSVVRITAGRDAVLSGDYIVPRKP